jgi:hypothetical protein
MAAAQRAQQVMVRLVDVTQQVGEAGAQTRARGHLLLPFLLLRGQTADHLLEGLLRGAPVLWDDVASLGEAARRWSYVVLCFGCDRASNNVSLLRYLWVGLRSSGLANVLLHAEPCAAHGVALSRAEGAAGSRRGAALVSLSKWLRTAKNSGALLDAIARQVSETVVMERRPFTEGERLRVRRVVSLLRSDSALAGAAVGAEGEEEPNTGGAVDRLFWLVLPCWDTLVLTHVCCGAGEAALHGGAPPACRDSREACVLKVTEALIQALFAPSWPVVCQSRWVGLSTVRRLFLVGALAGQALPRALESLLAGPRGPDRVAALRQQLVNDRADWAARQQLRLLRIALELCAADSWRLLAVEAAVDAACESLLAEVGASVAVRGCVEEAAGRGDRPSWPPQYPAELRGQGGGRRIRGAWR